MANGVYWSGNRGMWFWNWKWKWKCHKSEVKLLKDSTNNGLELFIITEFIRRYCMDETMWKKNTSLFRTVRHCFIYEACARMPSRLTINFWWRRINTNVAWNFKQLKRKLNTYVKYLQGSRTSALVFHQPHTVVIAGIGAKRSSVDSFHDMRTCFELPS